MATDPSRKSDAQIVQAWLGAALKLMLLLLVLGLVGIVMYAIAGWFGVVVPLLIVPVLLAVVHYGRRDRG